MKKCIAIFSDRTEDDIEVNGFQVMTLKESENFEELLGGISWSFDYDIDEVRLSYSSGEDLLTRLEFKDITEDEAKAFQRLFNGYFGIFISAEYIINNINDDASNNNEEDY